MAILHKYCSKCGANIKGAQGICPSCGKTLSEELLYENIEQVGAGGIGYSDITDHESFKAYKKYTKKVQMIGFPLIADRNGHRSHCSGARGYFHLYTYADHRSV